MTSEVSEIQLVSAMGMNPDLCLPPLPPKEKISTTNLFVLAPTQHVVVVKEFVETFVDDVVGPVERGHQSVEGDHHQLLHRVRLHVQHTPSSANSNCVDYDQDQNIYCPSASLQGNLSYGAH